MSVIDYVFAGETNFSCIANFDIGSVTPWSDHVPLSFSLWCDYLSDKSASRKETKLIWSNELKSEFRLTLIGKLPEFNDIVAPCADRQRGTVNDVVQRFTGALRGVTDPFSKDVMY